MNVTVAITLLLMALSVLNIACSIFGWRAQRRYNALYRALAASSNNKGEPE